MTAGGLGSTQWSVNQYVANGIINYTFPYEASTNTYQIYYNYNATTAIIYYNTTTQRQTTAGGRSITYTNANGLNYLAVFYTLSGYNPKVGRSLCNDLGLNSIKYNYTIQPTL